MNRNLRGVAYGLLGTFISRNNDIDGYWALGVLRLYAETRGLPSVTINLLLEPDEVTDSMIRIQERKYGEWFLNALAKSKIGVDRIKRAEVNLRFSTFEEFPRAIRYTRGQPFVCTVEIVKNDGYVISIAKLGCCEPHSPTKERRSVRTEAG